MLAHDMFMIANRSDPIIPSQVADKKPPQLVRTLAPATRPDPSSRGIDQWQPEFVSHLWLSKCVVCRCLLLDTVGAMGAWQIFDIQNPLVSKV